MKKRPLTMLALAALLSVLITVPAWAAPNDAVPPEARCAVCGMFVAKYPVWVTQIRHEDDTVSYFDGVKDMFAYYFDPTRYGSEDRESIAEIWVKDYYTLEWIDGRAAFYVTGSEVMGPMGPELIPFASREAAESFAKDHHGERLWTFDEVTPELIEKMRSGHKMKMKM